MCETLQQGGGGAVLRRTVAVNNERSVNVEHSVPSTGKPTAKFCVKKKKAILSKLDSRNFFFNSN